MAITEKSRHKLFQRLEELLGTEQAATLMEHLPPVGWADVATKRDLDAVRLDIDALAANTKRDLDALGDRIMAALYRSQRNLTLGLLSGMIALDGLLIAALR